MKTANPIKATLLAITTLALLTIISPALTATAHADDSDPGEVRGKCPYSLQLQKSVEAQRAYLVKVERAKASNPIGTPEEIAGGSVKEPVEMTEQLSVAWLSFTWGSASATAQATSTKEGERL
ncbi:hypothetical protein [Geomonas anaerohicana]|uniref:Secreted protein n=1 Tax=Geomonas anaerohicana TaxID=2798583 RepID=A0ABS0Y9E1_9BACT|nr:hypothetical protein [Geomonas anaerohicana]MBJ6748899.1 hypothetical protein [Geomonas anaerohicana]